MSLKNQIIVYAIALFSAILATVPFYFIFKNNYSSIVVLSVFFTHMIICNKKKQESSLVNIIITVVLTVIISVAIGVLVAEGVGRLLDKIV